MRLPRPLFVVLAVAVFVVSLGAGGAVGYGHAADAATATPPPGDGSGPRLQPGPARPTALRRPTATRAGRLRPDRDPGGRARPPRAPVRRRLAVAHADRDVAARRGGRAGAPARLRGPRPGPDVPPRRSRRPDRRSRCPGLVVSPDLFAAQLEALVAAGWRSITAAELAADLAAGDRPPPRTFVITFDDGRSDGYTQAFPILRRLGLVATFYVITGRIGMANNLSASQLRAPRRGRHGDREPHRGPRPPVARRTRRPRSSSSPGPPPGSRP